MPTKPKKNQPETPDEVQVRDNFLTPFYGTDLLVPFIPKGIKTVWEPACGERKMISRRLEHHGYSVYSTDLLFGQNFLDDEPNFEFDTIITNTPFSIKSKFYKKCLEYGKAFALLVPADYSGWIIEGIRNDHSEKIIPSRRIDYITPNIIDVIWRGQIRTIIEKSEKIKFKNFDAIPRTLINKYAEFVKRYNCLEEIPNEVIAKWSASQFHSMWLTWNFNIGQSETFVSLTKEMKRNIQ
jgi:hypothetical protein